MSGNIKHFQTLLGWERLDSVYYRTRLLNKTKNKYKKIIFDGENNYNNINDSTFSKYFFDLVTEYSIEENIVYIKSINDPDNILYSINININKGEHEENKLVSLKWDTSDEYNIVLIMAFQFNIKIIEFSDLVSESIVEFINEDDSMDEIWGIKENNIILSKRQQNFYKLNIKDKTIELLYNNTNTNEYSIFDDKNWIVKKDNGIILMSNNQLLLVKNGAVTKLRENCHFDLGALSFSNNFLSLFNLKLQKLLIVSTSNPNKTLVELNLKFKPKFLQWVGNDCVAVLDELENEVYLYGPNGNYITFWFNEINKVVLMETCFDGIKIFTSQNECHLISKVENKTKNIFQMGSMEQSSILTDCFEMYQEGQISKVLPILENINLKETVSEIIAASLQEFDPLVQKKLLSCATWGKSSMLIDSIKSKRKQELLDLNDQFEEACQRLRILNNINELLNFRITNKEFETLGINKIIHFLVNRPDCFDKDNTDNNNNVNNNSSSKPILTECLKLALFLKDYKLSIFVIQAFCIRKIKFNDEKSDDELFDQIVQVFDNLHLSKKFKFPFSSLFQVCISENRTHLAKKLILKDAVLKRHILPLLELDKESSDNDNLNINELLVETLNKVGDPLLQLFVLFEFKNRYKPSQLSRFLMLNNEKIDLNYFFKILENTENSIEQFGLSYDYYIQMDDVYGLLNLIWNRNALINISKSNALTQAEVIYKKNATNYSNNALVCHDIIKRDLRLFKYQKELFDKNGIDCNEKTVNETFKLIVTLANKKMIDQFMKEFQISEKQFYLCECLTAITKDIVDIERILILSSQRKFSKYIHLIYAKLVSNGYLQEATKIISLPNNEWPFEDKFNRYIECKQYETALELAEYQKDYEAIRYVTEIIESTTNI
ncbi:hypothetical protein ACO0SA_001825 [Hanseniaspora valbyensis]